jgi:TRAP-type C4-dicarboxylate transport system permease large subunit
LNGLACGVSKIPMAKVARAIWPNIVTGIIVIFIVTRRPWAATYLVDLIPRQGSKE